MSFNGAANSTFITLYHHHIIPEWRSNYISYDGLKCMYKDLKRSKSPDVSILDIALYSDIQRIIHFVELLLLAEKEQLNEVINHITMLESKISASSRKVEEIDDEDMTLDQLAVDGMLRRLYEENNKINKFLELNTFAIAKIAKKFRKVAFPAQFPSSGDSWAQYSSHTAFRTACLKLTEVTQAGQEIVDIYCSTFRKSYPELARAELNFDKDKYQQMKRTRTGLGIKLGIIIALVGALRYVYSSYIM